MSVACAPVAMYSRGRQGKPCIVQADVSSRSLCGQRPPRDDRAPSLCTGSVAWKSPQPHAASRFGCAGFLSRVPETSGGVSSVSCGLPCKKVRLCAGGGVHVYMGVACARACRSVSVYSVWTCARARVWRHGHGWRVRMGREAGMHGCVCMGGGLGMHLSTSVCA